MQAREGDTFSRLASIAVGLALGFMLDDVASFRADDGAYADNTYADSEMRQLQRRLSRLATTVGTVPALAGAAAALAGVMQQVVDALGGVAAGWVTHDGPVPLALLMRGLTLASLAAQALIPRR